MNKKINNAATTNPANINGHFFRFLSFLGFGSALDLADLALDGLDFSSFWTGSCFTVCST